MKKAVDLPIPIILRLSRRIRFLVVLNLMVCSVTAGGRRPSPIALCVTIQDPGGGLASDGAGEYCDQSLSSQKPAGLLKAQITPEGYFTFATGTPETSGRCAGVDVTMCIDLCDQPAQWPPPGLYQISLSTTGPDFGTKNPNLTTLTPGVPIPVGLVMHIWRPCSVKWPKGVEWIVVFGNWPNGQFPCDDPEYLMPDRHATVTGYDLAGADGVLDYWEFHAPATARACLLSKAGVNAGLVPRGDISFAFDVQFRRD